MSEATTRGVSFQLWVDGRYVALGTSDLRPEALKKLIGDGTQMARAITAEQWSRRGYLPRLQEWTARRLDFLF